MDAYESIRAEQFDDAGRALATGRVAVGRLERQRVDTALQAVGLAIPLNAPSWQDAAFKATADLHSALQSIRAGVRGEYVPTPAMPAKPPEIEMQPAPQGGMLLGAVIDEYIANLRKTTFTRKVNRCLQLFGAMVGRDTPIQALKQLAVTAFLRDICRLPTDWTKRYDKGVSVAAMLTKGTENAMSPTTYNDNYRAPLGTFLAASLRDYGDDGFPARTVGGIEYSGTRRADEDQQRALSEPDALRSAVHMAWPAHREVGVYSQSPIAPKPNRSTIKNTGRT